MRRPNPKPKEKAMLIPLREIKQQLRIEHMRDRALDNFLEQKYHMAIDYAQKYMNRAIPFEDEEEINPSVREAVLLLIAGAYENRESEQHGTAHYSTNPAVERLLHFHRIDLGV